MADEQQKPIEQNEEKQSKPPGIMQFALIMLAGAFIASFITAKFMTSAIKEQLQTEKTVHDSKEKKKGAHGSEAFYRLGEFVVNLSNKEATRYLKTDITIKVSGGKEVEKLIKEKESVYRDVILEKLSACTTQQLTSTEGKKNLKNEILDSIRDLDSEIKIENIYFNSLIMQ
jgi:flagellar basal body-associated protein FliL